MLPPLETALIWISPILGVIILTLVASMWRITLATIRSTTDRLNALEERFKQLDRLDTRPPAAPRGNRDRSTKRNGPLRRVDPSVHPNLKDPAPAVNLISVPNLAHGTESQSAPESDLNRRFAAVWDLAEAGASSETIARTTGQPVGQIELILGLKRQTDSTAAGPRLPGTSSR